MVVKPLAREGGKLVIADEDGIKFETTVEQNWIGYRVIVWGALPDMSQGKPPIIHYLRELNLYVDNASGCQRFLTSSSGI